MSARTSTAPSSDLGSADRASLWRSTPSTWATVSFAALLVCVFALEPLTYMIGQWSSEEYSYAYMLPAVILFMLWQKRETLARLPFHGSWVGTGLVLLALMLSLVGELSALYVVVEYAALAVIGALVLSFMGRKAFREVFVPLMLLAFMIPLPTFLYQGVSGQFQLISSRLGVALIRLFGISVLLEGNVIDLGSYRLQVAEACSGLRYLFPLLALGFIAAYFFKQPVWKRVVVFLSAIPITILMNSFRIGVIGIMVEHWGRAAAEGFLHDFEGWTIFMACAAVLVGEMWLLSRIGAEPGSRFRDIFVVDIPASPGKAATMPRSIPLPFMGALLLLVIAVVTFAALPQRTEAQRSRKDFAQFPMKLEQWQGTPEQLDVVYLDALKLDDYIFANYFAKGKRPVNFYVAYYASQRKGESAHSPRSCIPGGGWEITDLTQRDLPEARVAGKALQVNRVLIEKGDDKQLVYYWFHERGRNLTNEYAVKWYLFWDALTRQRTDGALVRLITKVDTNLDVREADRQLSHFAAIVARRLPDYVPD